MERSRRKKSKDILLLTLSATLCWLSFIQYRYHFLTFLPLGQSDIVGFWNIRFSDGISHWPYSTYTNLVTNKEIKPVEYPTITGIVIWLTSIPFPDFAISKFSYFALNCFLISFLYVATVYFVRKIAGLGLSKILVYSPVVALSLYLNWDMWAVLPLIIGIYLFVEKRFFSSGILVGFSIATKFFPVLMFLPISIYFSRNRNTRAFLGFFSAVSLIWTLINVPLILTNYDGWIYFYRFNAIRGLGEGSIYDAILKFGLIKDIPIYAYFITNILAFVALSIFLYKVKDPINPLISSFLTIGIFTFFGKQYSIQYVLWLTPLAIISLSTFSKQEQRPIFRSLVLWQVGEFVMWYAYFKNKLGEMSAFVYAELALIRYLTFSVFLFSTITAVLRTENQQLKRKH